MPYTWNDYYRDVTREHLDWLPKEELLAKLSVEDRLRGLPPEDIEAYLNKVLPQKRKRNDSARAHKKGRA